VRELDFGRRFHALHVQGGVQTFKDGPSVGLGTQDLKLLLALVNFICSVTSCKSNCGTLNKSP
jgi:hypothetical protein